MGIPPTYNEKPDMQLFIMVGVIIRKYSANGFFSIIKHKHNINTDRIINPTVLHLKIKQNIF